MAPRQKSRFWRICRIYFRRFRITVWLLILLILGSLIYVNQIGLPGFIKRPLLQTLRDRGIDLQFSRLRLSWYQGIVAENVRFGRPSENFGPQLKLQQVQVQLNPRALLRLSLQVDALNLRQGRLEWPIPGTNSAWRELTAENIQTELRFLPNDQWALDNFKASFAGARLQLSGSVTNASKVREWKFLRSRATQSTPAAQLQERLEKLADTLDRIQFSAPPDLKLDVRGDAADPQTFQVRLMLHTPGAETPWGSVIDGKFTAHLFPAGTNEVWGEVDLQAANTQTPWAIATNVHLAANVLSVQAQPDLVSCRLSLSAQSVETKWGSAGSAHFTADWVHALTNLVPLSGHGILECQDVLSERGSATTVQLRAHLNTGESRKSYDDPAWGWWAALGPYLVDWDAHVVGVASPKLVVQEIQGGGRWAAPVLAITNLQAELYEGRLQASGTLDVSSRLLKASLDTDVDAHKISPLLTEGARYWLSQFSWGKAPELQTDIGLILPAWTNRQPDWQAEVQPNLIIDGHFRLGQGGAFRGVPADSAESHFSYSNMIWRLPDLVANRPEGRIRATHIGNDRTREFYWRVQSSIIPQAILPVLEEDQARVLELFKFNQPPCLDGEIWGHWRHPDRIGFKGTVAVTNFSFRGEHLDEFTAALEYTNRVLMLTGAKARVGNQHISADAVKADFAARKAYLTNGFSTADPQMIGRAIGPEISEIILPYQFLNPPTARVNGTIPMGRAEDADMQFEIAGGHFSWWKFNVPEISGRLNWVGKKLAVNDVRAKFYGGTAAGSAHFDFSPLQGVNYRFVLFTTNAVLQFLMADLTGRTNNPEGILNGSMVISRASSEDPKILDGYGSLELRDGLIWAIPIFGVLSPALDSLVPGLGSSRANAATGTFTISNGVLQSDDLEIRAPAMRLDYRGTLDVEGRLNARVEAALLRDMWVIGPLVSTVLWPVTKLFEYKVTGPLEQPKIEPVYFVPKLVLMPFHPIRTLKELFPDQASPPGTNGPPSRTQ